MYLIFKYFEIIFVNVSKKNCINYFLLTYKKKYQMPSTFNIVFCVLLYYNNTI